MYKENKIRTKDLRLDKYPSLRELYLFKVMHEPHTYSRLSWPDKRRDGEFCLIISTDNLGRIADWRLHLTTRICTSQIWSATTNDVLQVCKAVSTLGGGNVVDLRPYGDKEEITNVGIEDHHTPELQQEANAGYECADALKDLFKAAGQEYRRRAADATVSIDALKINAQLSNSGDRDTTVMTYPALLYYLGKQYDHHSRTQTPFSLVLLSTCLVDEAAGGSSIGTNLAQTAEIIHRLGLTKRPTDLISLYRMDVLALMLPDTNRAGAEAFIRRALSRLHATPLPAMPITCAPVFSSSTACVPDDCEEVAGLLSKAESNLLRTSRTRLPIVAHSKYNEPMAPPVVALPQMAAAI